MAFLLGFFVGPVIDKVGKVITNTGGMMFGDKERKDKLDNILARLENLNTAIEAKVITAHKKRHKEKSVFTNTDDTGDERSDDDGGASRQEGEDDGKNGCTKADDNIKKKKRKTDKTPTLSLAVTTKVVGFGKKMHDRLKKLPKQEIIDLSKFDDKNVKEDSPTTRKRTTSTGSYDGSSVDDDDAASCCVFLNPLCEFMRENCEFYGCIEETTREVVVNVDTMGKEIRSNVETIRTTVAGTGISDFDDPVKFKDISPMFTNFDKDHHSEIQQFAHDLKVWYYTDKNEGLSKLGRDYHLDLLIFDERLEKIETAYEIRFASDNQREINEIKSKLDKIESMLKENNRKWILSKRYYINVFTVLLIFHVLFHLLLNGEVDINPFNDLERLQQFLKSQSASHR